MLVESRRREGGGTIGERVLDGAVTTAGPVQFGAFSLDFDRPELRREGIRVAVQRRQLDLLVHLVRHRDRVILRDELLAQVWHDVTVCSAALTQALSELRRILEDPAGRPWAIRTIHARGYRFVAPVSPLERTPTNPPHVERWREAAAGHSPW